MTVMDSPVGQIRHFRARRYVDTVNEKRAWLRAYQSMTQMQLAAAMGVSQPNVSDIVRRARVEVGETPRPGFHGSSAYEIAARYHLDEIDRSTMLAELSRWPYETTPRAAEADVWRADGQVPVAGSFADEIGRAFDDGLLTDADYDELLDGWAEN